MVNRKMACLALAGTVVLLAESFAMDQLESPMKERGLRDITSSFPSGEETSYSDTPSLQQKSLKKGGSPPQLSELSPLPPFFPRSSSSPGSSPKSSPKKYRLTFARDQNSAPENLRFVYSKTYKDHSKKLKAWLNSTIARNNKAQDLVDSAVAKNGKIKVKFESLADNSFGFSSFYDKEKKCINLSIASIISVFPKAKDVSNDAASTSPECYAVLWELLEFLDYSMNEKLHKIMPVDYKSPKAYAEAMMKMTMPTQEYIHEIFRHGQQHCGWHASITLEEGSPQDLHRLYVKQYDDDFAKQAETSPRRQSR